MAIGAGGLAAITAGAQLLGTGANAYATGRMNRASRQFAQEQAQVTNDRNQANWQAFNKYNEGLRDEQRSYDLEMWNMQNEYNSPREQMKRFQEAGLNPNLIYGSNNAMGGTIANSGISAQGQEKAEKAEWKGVAPQIDLHSGLSSMFDNRLKSAQQDLVAEQAKLTQEEAALINAKKLTELTNNDALGFDLGLKRDLRDSSLQAAEQAVEKLKQEVATGKATEQYTKGQNRRADQLQNVTLAQGRAAIRKMEAETENEKLKAQLHRADLVLKDLERKYGGWWGGQVVGRTLESIPSLWEKFKANWTEPYDREGNRIRAVATPDMFNFKK